MEFNEYWVVGMYIGGYWKKDFNGPEILYEDEDKALAWAQKIAPLYDHVRLEHTVKTYRTVK